MSRTDTIYVGSNLTDIQRSIQMQKQDARILTVDFSPYCGIEGVELETVDWAILDNATNLDLTGEITSGYVTSSIVTASESGEASIQCSAVLDNGEQLILLFRVCVIDPEPILTNDYRC